VYVKTLIMHLIHCYHCCTLVLALGVPWLLPMPMPRLYATGKHMAGESAAGEDLAVKNSASKSVPGKDSASEDLAGKIVAGGSVEGCVSDGELSWNNVMSVLWGRLTQ
jgi:hypothetical protein